MTRRLLMVSLAALAACGPRRPAAGTSATLAPCAPGGSVLPADASAGALLGSYRLELVAARGARSGESTAADLELVAADDSLRTRPGPAGLRDTTTRYPLVGWTTMDPTAVGGADTGPLDAQDPSAPGILVIERRTRRADAPKEILLRLGSEANQRDRLRFDGGYFALTVLRVDDDGFAGTWASAAEGAGAGGHFCAHRTER